MWYYAGIGSRETPLEVQKRCEQLATDLAALGGTLRSGGADGADAAFERGCKSVRGPMEIFLPWKNMNNNPSPFKEPPEDAFEIAFELRPHLKNSKPGVQKLMARNVQQILGPVPYVSPISSCVICYTMNGHELGGTSFAMQLARLYNIPIFNMYWLTNEEILAQVKKLKGVVIL